MLALQCWLARACTLYVVLATAIVLSGCGGNPNLFHASGTITLDGKPLENAFVTFIPTGGGTTSYGKTDDSGHYEMQFSDVEAGAWKGQNRVEIRTGDVGAGGAPAPPERVPAAYNNASTLLAEVKSGNNVFDFDLKSGASKIVQPVFQ